MAKDPELAGNLAAAAHLIHGSTEGRFTVRYAAGGLTREEIEPASASRGATSASSRRRYDPARLVDGMNVLDDGEEVFLRLEPRAGALGAGEPVPRMTTQSLHDLFSLEGKLALVTGGTGVLGSAMCRGLALAGAHVIVTHRTEGGRRGRAAAALREAGHVATGFGLDTLDRASLRRRAARAGDLGGVDILINAVGGNRKEATTGPDRPFAALSREATEQVFALNFFGGAFSAAQAFAPQLVEKEAGGVILNVTSMSALRPLSRVPGYSAAKAAVDNFTRWLAVHLAEEHNPRVRVNAVAPGFFLTAQNRFLLTEEGTGALTPRGRAILDHTPMGRFGEPGDLIGTVVWLCSDAARFVTGITVPVDGGFSAGCGV